MRAKSLGPRDPAPAKAGGGDNEKVTAVHNQLIVHLSAPEATDADRFGPKAANLARLGQAGLPIPGGFCVDAEAYRIQVRALGLEDTAREVLPLPVLPLPCSKEGEPPRGERV